MIKFIRVLFEEFEQWHHKLKETVCALTTNLETYKYVVNKKKGQFVNKYREFKLIERLSRELLFICVFNRLLCPGELFCKVIWRFAKARWWISLYTLFFKCYKHHLVELNKPNVMNKLNSSILRSVQFTKILIFFLCVQNLNFYLHSFYSLLCGL